MISIILLFFLVLFTLKFSLKNIEQAYWFNYIVYLAFPIGVYAEISTQKYFQINSFQISEISLAILFICCLLKLWRKKRIKILTLDKLVFVLGFVIFIATLYSFEKNGSMALIDGKQYIMHIILYFSARLSLNNITIEKIFNMTLIGSVINSLIIFVFFVNSLFIGFNGRISFGSQSLYIITIPYVIYLLLYKNIKIRFKIGLAFILILQSYLFILSGNRSNILPIVLGVFLTIVINDKKRTDIRKYSKIIFWKITRVFIAVLIIIFTVSFIMKSNSIVFSRYQEVINSGVENQSSIKIRNSTKIYYESIINEKPFEIRLGKYMPHIYPDHSSPESKETLQTDNNFLVVKYKLGSIIFMLYILVYIVAVYYILRQYKHTKQNIYIYILLISIFGYIGVGMMTSQILHNISIYSYYITLVAVVIDKRIQKNLKIKKIL